MTLGGSGSDRGGVTTGRRFSLRRITGGANPYPLVILAALNIVDELDRQAFGLLVPEIRRSFGLDIGGVLLLVALFTPVTILLGLPVGFLADRARRVRLARIGAGLWALFSFFTGLAMNVIQLGAARAGSGIAKTVNEPTHNSLLADYYPVDVRAGVFAVYRGAQPIGLMLAPILAGVLALVFSWRMPFLVFAAPTVLLVILSARLKEPPRGVQDRLALGVSHEEAAQEETPPGFSEAWRSIYAVRSLRRIFLALPFVGASAFGIGSLLSLFYEDVYHVDVATRGVLFALNEPWTLLGLTVGAPVAQRLLNRDPGLALKFLGISATAVGVSIGIIALSPNLAVAVGANWLFAFSGSILIPGLYAVFSIAIPARTRSMGFVAGTIWFLPGVLVLPVIGQVAEAQGIRFAMLILIPLYVGGSLIMASAGRFLAADIHSVRVSSMAEHEVRQALAEGEPKLLLVRNLDVAYDQVQVLFGVDFSMKPGEIVALLGTNGAGKSTLLKAISGIVDPANGAVYFDGLDITHASPVRSFKLGVVQVPGGRAIFPTLTVKEHLELASWTVGRDDADIDAVRDEIFDVLPQLRERLDQMAGNLSGGEQQMLGIAMALVARPKLLMIDELSLGLAPAIVEQLLATVRRIHAQGTAIILVEQSVNVALSIADRAYFMEKGEIRFSGKTADLFGRPDILRAVFLQGTAAALAEDSSNGKARVSTPLDRQMEVKLEPALQISNLIRSFGGIAAVNDVSFTLYQGEILGLIGPNGAGKTTIFDLISGFLPPDSGAIVFRGQDITDWPPDRRAYLGLGRSFQDSRLFPSLTVAECIAVSLECHLEIRDHFAEALSLPKVREQEASIRFTVNELIELMHLEVFRNKFIGELSTGTRRICDLAMALALDPSVLILDEPSSGIAQRETEALGPLLLEIRRELGCTLLVIEHDMPLITGISHRMVALDLGRVIAEGRPDEVTSDPHVVKSYLGGDAAVIQRSGALATTRRRATRAPQSSGTPRRRA